MATLSRRAALSRRPCARRSARRWVAAFAFIAALTGYIEVDDQAIRPLLRCFVVSRHSACTLAHAASPSDQLLHLPSSVLYTPSQRARPHRAPSPSLHCQLPTPSLNADRTAALHSPQLPRALIVVPYRRYACRLDAVRTPVPAPRQLRQTATLRRCGMSAIRGYLLQGGDRLMQSHWFSHACEERSHDNDSPALPRIPAE
jgi:hypothetical protein